jgi:Dna[CI] antecedent, DciA
MSKSKLNLAPTPLSDILNDLFALRGYRRLCARQALEDVWNNVVGESYYRKTRLGELRNGVLRVVVANSMVLEELAAFRKAALLKALRAGVPTLTLNDIRFQVGASSTFDAVGGGGSRPGTPGSTTSRGDGAISRREIDRRDGSNKTSINT